MWSTKLSKPKSFFSEGSYVEGIWRDGTHAAKREIVHAGHKY